MRKYPCQKMDYIVIWTLFNTRNWNICPYSVFIAYSRLLLPSLIFAILEQRFTHRVLRFQRFPALPFFHIPVRTSLQSQLKSVDIKTIFRLVTHSPLKRDNFKALRHPYFMHWRATHKLSLRQLDYVKHYYTNLKELLGSTDSVLLCFPFGHEIKFYCK